jgi:hypothetical protein
MGGESYAARRRSEESRQGVHPVRQEGLRGPEVEKEVGWTGWGEPLA